MIGNAFVLAVRQISRNPLRSLLTVLGVVIGVMAVITMVTVGNGASQAIRTQIESFGNNQLMLRPGLRMGPGQSVGAPNFTLEDADALKRQIAGIVAVAPQASKTMTVVANGRNWQTSVIGTDNNYFTIDNREIVDGRTFEQGEMQSGAAVCVIGGTIQKELFGEGAEVIGRTIRTGSFSCRVVGLLKTKGTAAMGGDQDDLLVMPIKTLQRRILGKNRVGALLVSVNPQSDRDRLRDAVTELMRERRSLSDGDDDNFQILDTAEIAAKVASTTQIMTTLLAAVAAVSLLVGGIGIMNIMLVSVTERTREIGIRLAIGALEREVLLQFLIEALMLGCMGGALGVLAALGVSKALAVYMGVPFIFSPGINLLAFTVSALTGVVFGFFPARRAAKLDPIEAVCHEWRGSAAEKQKGPKRELRTFHFVCWCACQIRMKAKAHGLERNVVAFKLVEGGVGRHRGALAGWLGSWLGSGTRGARSAFEAVVHALVVGLAAVEELHRFADDFGGVAVSAVLGLVLAGAQAAFDVALAALVEVFLGDFGKAGEEDHAVPFGFADGLAFGVAVAARRGDVERRDGGAAVRRVAGFGISAEIADQDYLVDGSHD